MSIYDYGSGEHTHPSGSTGIRVNLSIGGEIHEKWFEEGENRDAEEFHDRLVEKRDIFNRKRARLRAPRANGKSYTKTAVCGMSINIKKCKGRAGQVYYRCIIATSVMSKLTGKPFTKNYIVTKDTLQKVWYAACVDLCRHTGITSVPKRWVEERPVPNNFRTLISKYKEAKLLLDIGFQSLPKSRYPSARSDVIRG